MDWDKDEENLLRAVTLQNARAVLLARERAERDLIETKVELDRSNHQITAILESITDGFFALDQDWRFTYLNRKGEETLRPGSQKGSLLGKVIWDEFPDARGTEIEQNYRRAVRDQVTVEFETYYEPLNTWFSVRAYPATHGLSVYFQDVTERRAAQEALRNSEERFRATFNQASVGISLVALDGHFEQVNKRFCELFGYSQQELSNLTFMDLTHPDDAATTRENVRRLNEKEIADYTYEKRFICKNGTIVWGQTSVTLLKDAEGRAQRYVGVVEDITKRKVAEQASREAADRLQLALSAGQLGHWTWIPETDLVILGPEAAEMFGFRDGAPVSWKTMRERLHEEDREKARIAPEEALQNHTDYHLEYRIQRGDDVRWIASRGRGVYAADGQVQSMIGIVQDITDRKKAEEIHSRLAAVVESSDDAILSMTLDAIVTTWNIGAQRMFGYTAGEMIGRSVTLLLPPGREDEEPQILHRLRNGERIDHYETVRLHKDGRLIDVSLSVSPIYDANGDVIGASKISRDITAQKRAEQALQEESRVLEILNRTGITIAAQLELKSLVQTVTDAATEISGAKFGAFFYNVMDDAGESFLLYTLSGAPREAFEKFGHPRATPIFSPTFKGEGPVRSADITRDPRYGQMPPHHGMPKGHLPVRSYLAVPVISRTGEVIGGLFFGHPDPNIFTERAERLVVGVAAQAAVSIDNARLYDSAQREITERRKVEAALREAQEKLRHHAEGLEDQVAERTAKLRETIGELEAFSYSVSHDMRSPLRAMQGYSEALLDDYATGLDETAQDYLQRIRRAASRMDLLINDVLAYSKVAKENIRLTRVDFGQVIQDIVQHYPALQPSKAKITICDPIPHVLGHEAYLNQIASNILSNAVKFVEPGTLPVINVRTRVDGDTVRVSFHDNGIGIAPEHQGQIFRIFERVYSDKKFEGTGIGLAIVRKAAERLGGNVTVESETGKGSTFHVNLKRAE